jgi:hypothetical protein
MPCPQLSWSHCKSTPTASSHNNRNYSSEPEVVLELELEVGVSALHISRPSRVGLDVELELLSEDPSALTGIDQRRGRTNQKKGRRLRLSRRACRPSMSPFATHQLEHLSGLVGEGAEVEVGGLSESGAEADCLL